MTTSTDGPKSGRAKRRPGGLDLRKILLEGRAFLALIVIIVVFSILSPNYLTTNNLLTMASHVAVYALLGIGMLLVVLNGGIDLTVGATLGLCGVIAGALMKGVPLKALGDVTLFPQVWVVVVLACAVGALIGLINGILVSRFKVAPFVATLGMLYVVRGIALLMTNGLTYNNLGGRADLGNTGFDWLGFNRILNVPIGVIVMAVVAIVVSVLLHRSVFGRWLYASGGNERAAELSGVPVKRVKVWVYVASGRLRRHRRPDPLVRADLGEPDRRHVVRADRHRRGRDRRRRTDRRAGQRPRHPARRLRHRLPVRRARHRRCLRLLANRLHRRRHHPGGAAERRAVPRAP